MTIIHIIPQSIRNKINKLTNINSKHRKYLEIEELKATWCELLLGKKKILIGVFYRPPSANIEYWKKVEDSIELAKDRIRSQMEIFITA